MSFGRNARPASKSCTCVVIPNVDGSSTGTCGDSGIRVVVGASSMRTICRGRLGVCKLMFCGSTNFDGRNLAIRTSTNYMMLIGSTSGTRAMMCVSSPAGNDDPVGLNVRAPTIGNEHLIACRDRTPCRNHSVGFIIGRGAPTSANESILTSHST